MFLDIIEPRIKLKTGFLECILAQALWLDWFRFDEVSVIKSHDISQRLLFLTVKGPQVP